MYVLQFVVYPFVLFLLDIVLSVLRYTDSDCPFGIFKLIFSLLFINNLSLRISVSLWVRAQIIKHTHVVWLSLSDFVYGWQSCATLQIKSKSYMGRDPFCIYGTGPFVYPTSILLIKRQAPVLLSIMTYMWLQKLFLTITVCHYFLIKR